MKRGRKELIRNGIIMLLLCSLFLPYMPAVRTGAAQLQNPGKENEHALWDCIWFGSYPQSEVEKNSGLYQKLENVSLWSGSNETVLDGVKYKRMKKADASYAPESNYYAYYTWEDETSWHYFTYEPVKWRVLDVTGDAVLLLADRILDVQVYNSGSETADKAVPWTDSELRRWLNGADDSFLNRAFTADEQRAIADIDLYPGYLEGVSDKVTILTGDEMSEAFYGFWGQQSSKARKAGGSTYAFARGLRRGIDGETSDWWVLPNRPVNSIYLADASGSIKWNNNYFYKQTENDVGIRPAICLDLRKAMYTHAGTVRADGEVKETEKPGNRLDSAMYKVSFEAYGVADIPEQGAFAGGRLKQPETPVREGYTFDGWYNGDEKWDFEKGRVDSDISLTARWIDPETVYRNNRGQLIDRNGIQIVELGTTFTLGYGVSVYDKITSYSWYEDDSTILAINGPRNGPEARVRAAGVGVSTVWASVTSEYSIGGLFPVYDSQTMENPHKRRVVAPAAEIELAAEEMELEVGQSCFLDYTTVPAGNYARTVGGFQITSSKEDVVTIDEQGGMVAKQNGTAVITLSLANGVSKTCEVVVTEKKQETPPTEKPDGKLVIGDVDGDRQITLADVQKALQAALYIDSLAGDAFLAADVDYDEQITIQDAGRILKAVLRIEPLP